MSLVWPAPEDSGSVITSPDDLSQYGLVSPRLRQDLWRLVYHKVPFWGLYYTLHIVSPIGRWIASHGVEYHQYADDIQIFTRMTVPFAIAFDSLQGCVESLQYRPVRRDD